MKASELIARIRRQVSDAAGSPRWGTPLIIDYMNDGIRKITNDRKESKYVSGVSTDPVPEITSENDTIPIHDSFLNALMHFVCEKILSEDSEDASNRALADRHRIMYQEEMA